MEGTRVTEEDDAFKLTIPVDDSYSPEQRKVSGKSSQKIIGLLRNNPQITIERMAAEIGISSRSTKKYLANLQTAGVIQRIGPDKGGKWVVIEQDKTEK